MQRSGRGARNSSRTAIGAGTSLPVSAFEEEGSIDANVVAGIAHDINNVLTVVRLHADFVLSGPLTRAQQNELGSAIEATIRGAALTQQMLGLIRHHARETLICELNEIVSSTAESLGRVIGPDIALVTELSSSPNPVRSRAGQVDRILLNLVLNARDAMPRGGRLTVTVRRAVIAPGHGPAHELPPGCYATLSVQDTGLGMSSELKSSIFDPFFTTKSARGGTGLGLPVVLQEVRDLRGAICVESELGEGSMFIIYLPLVVEAARIPQDAQ
jgi:signal transduction histidine kinase